MNSHRVITQRAINWLMIYLLLLTFAASAQGPGDLRRAVDPIPGEYIVVLPRDTPNATEAARALTRGSGGRVGAVITSGISAFAFKGSEQAALALARNPNVEWVEEVSSVSTSSVPPNCTWVINPLYPYGPLGTWHCYYPSTPAFEYWNLQRLTGSFTSQYVFYGTGWNVIAYVVDGGIRANHTEFDNRVIRGIDVTGEFQALNPCGGIFQSADYGAATHGTAVASVLGGTTAGVVKEVSLESVKVGTCAGSITSLDVVKGLEAVLVDHGFRGSPN